MDNPVATPAPDASDNMRDLIRAVDALPSPPPVAVTILSAVNESSDFAEVAALTASDPSLTLKVLKLANSPAYSRQGRVASLDKALVIVGVAALKSILLGTFIRGKLLADRSPSDPIILDFWKHSLGCAVTAQLLAERLAPELREDAFVAGMIHDLGKAALLVARPEAYERVLDYAARTGGDLSECERTGFGADHGLAGKWLAESWGLPPALVDVVWLHHQADALPDFPGFGKRGRGDARNGHGNALLGLVMLADRLCREVMVDYNGSLGDLEGPVKSASLAARLRVKPQILDDVRPQIAQRFAERADLYDLSMNTATFYAEALQRANGKLVSLSVSGTHEQTTLTRSRQVLEAASNLAASLATADTAEKMLDALARDVFSGLGCPRGAVFLAMDGAAARAMGWLDGRRIDAGEPADWPAPLRELVTFPRILQKEKREGDILALPLLFAGERFGDLFLSRPLASCPFSEQEAAAYRQIAHLLAANLHRLALARQLAQRAEELSSALGRLSKARETAMQAERLAAVGQLAAGAAHEINNPLSIVYARAQLMEHKEQDAAKKRSLRQMMEQIERITGILQNLMDFARPAPPRLRETSLNDAAEKTLALLADGLRANKVRAERDLGQGLPRIMADPAQLQSLIVNLCINAQHAMQHKGGGTLSVRTRHDPDKDRVLLVVRDTGVGIKKEVLSRIFEPFFTTKEAGKGTGLGLSICYGIVQGHGGSIDIESEDGSFTEVVVAFPLPAQEKAAKSAPVESAEAETPRGPGADVLVVDDEAHIRDILSEALTAEGLSVDTARNGHEALQRISSGRYRLVLLDVVMPRLDGLSVLRALVAKRPGLPVIVLTGLAGQAEMRQIAEIGAVCLTKPFQMDEILAHARRLLTGEHGS